MKILKKDILNSRFSHIYIEKSAFNYKLTNDILSKYKNSKIIEIDNYKEVFSSNNQNFSLQKLTPKLILAVKKENMLYKGAKVCEDFENENFYYTSSIINCIYDCEYCYLQGVYPTANIVIFVNIEDVFLEIEDLLQKLGSMYLCISYDTDLLALDSICNFIDKWYSFVKDNTNLKIELRTKSANISSLLSKENLDNFIIAFTLSPQQYSINIEKYTATFNKRIEAIQKLQEKNWKIRLCIDPLIYEEDFEVSYSKMIDEIFSNIDSINVLDVSIGVFRISKEYLKKMRKQNQESKVLFYPYEVEDGVYSYPKEKGKYMIDFVKQNLLKYIDESKIFI